MAYYVPYKAPSGKTLFRVQLRPSNVAGTVQRGRTFSSGGGGGKPSGAVSEARVRVDSAGNVIETYSDGSQRVIARVDPTQYAAGEYEAGRSAKGVLLLGERVEKTKEIPIKLGTAPVKETTQVGVVEKKTGARVKYVEPGAPIKELRGASIAVEGASITSGGVKYVAKSGVVSMAQDLSPGVTGWAKTVSRVPSSQIGSVDVSISPEQVSISQRVKVGEFGASVIAPYISPKFAPKRVRAEANTRALQAELKRLEAQGFSDVRIQKVQETDGEGYFVFKGVARAEPGTTFDVQAIKTQLAGQGFKEGKAGLSLSLKKYEFPSVVETKTTRVVEAEEYPGAAGFKKELEALESVKGYKNPVLDVVLGVPERVGLQFEKAGRNIEWAQVSGRIPFEREARQFAGGLISTVGTLAKPSTAIQTGIVVGEFLKQAPKDLPKTFGAVGLGASVAAGGVITSLREKPAKTLGEAAGFALVLGAGAKGKPVKPGKFKVTSETPALLRETTLVGGDSRALLSVGDVSLKGAKLKIGRKTYDFDLSSGYASRLSESGVLAESVSKVEVKGVGLFRRSISVDLSREIGGHAPIRLQPTALGAEGTPRLFVQAGEFKGAYQKPQKIGVAFTDIQKGVESAFVKAPEPLPTYFKGVRAPGAVDLRFWRETIYAEKPGAFRVEKGKVVLARQEIASIEKVGITARQLRPEDFSAAFKGGFPAYESYLPSVSRRVSGERNLLIYEVGEQRVNKLDVRRLAKTDPERELRRFKIKGRVFDEGGEAGEISLELRQEALKEFTGEGAPVLQAPGKSGGVSVTFGSDLTQALQRQQFKFKQYVGEGVAPQLRATGVEGIGQIAKQVSKIEARERGAVKGLALSVISRTGAKTETRQLSRGLSLERGKIAFLERQKEVPLFKSTTQERAVIAQRTRPALREILIERGAAFERIVERAAPKDILKTTFEPRLIPRSVARTSIRTVTTQRTALRGIPALPVVSIPRIPRTFITPSGVSAYRRPPQRRKAKQGRRKRSKTELFPISDWLSKTVTEGRLGRPAKSPSVKVSRKWFFKTAGLRVPTAEMLFKRKKGRKNKR